MILSGSIPYESFICLLQDHGHYSVPVPCRILRKHFLVEGAASGIPGGRSFTRRRVGRVMCRDVMGGTRPVLGFWYIMGVRVPCSGSGI